MTLADRLAQPRYAKAAHPEEWLSILISLIGTVVATAFIWSAPGFEPASGPLWTVPVWLALAYLLVQLDFLLVSATQIRALGCSTRSFRLCRSSPEPLPLLSGFWGIFTFRHSRSSRLLRSSLPVWRNSS